MTAIYPYPTRAVRDLAWACFSPTLLHTAQLHTGLPVSDLEPELNTARQAWLEGLERNSAKLTDALAQSPPRRLGLYFERLWQFFLREDAQTQLVAHNLPVHDGGRTLGEFDCIYFCARRGCYVHLELAAKFYLGVQTAAGTRWYGPNQRDRLDLKLAHLLERQIRLGEQPAAVAQLRQLGVNQVEREIVLRGCLFQPWPTPLDLPAGYNHDCATGQWLTLGSLPEYCAATSTDALFPVPHMHWLSPIDAGPDEILTLTDLQRALTRRFAQGSRPMLVATLDTGGAQTGRFFITPDDWPQDIAAVP